MDSTFLLQTGQKNPVEFSSNTWNTIQGKFKSGELTKEQAHEAIVAEGIKRYGLYDPRQIALDTAKYNIYDMLEKGFTPNPITQEQPKPVTQLSTSNAVATVQRNKKKLDQYSNAYVKDAQGFLRDAQGNIVVSAGQTVTPQNLSEQGKQMAMSYAKNQPEPKVYFTNANGQEAEANQKQLGDPNFQKFLSEGGYAMTKSDGIPYGSSVTTTPSPLDNINKQIEDQYSQFASFNVDTDPQFQAQANNIRTQYDALRREMQKANESNMASVATSGIRGGAGRYARDIQRTIESGELSAANQRMLDINTKEASALSEARTAYQNGKFTEFTTKINALDKIRDSKQKELENYQKTIGETIKKIQEQTKQASRDSAIAGLLDQGITDPKQILGYLNYDNSGRQIGDFTAKDVSETIKNLTGTFGSGIIGEYQYAKSQGYKGTFNDYQNEDANRKRSVTNISVGNLTPAQERIVDKSNASFENSPEVKAFSEIQNKYLNMIKSTGRGDGATDIAVIYDLMKSLDPTSVVRTEEYNTGASKSGNIFVGGLAKLNGLIDPKGGFVSDTAKQNILGVIKDRFDVAKEQYKNLRDERVRVLEKKGIVGARDYLTDYDYTSEDSPVNQIVNKQKNAENKLNEIYPTKAKEVDSIIKAQPGITDEEILQVLGISY